MPVTGTAKSHIVYEEVGNELVVTVRQRVGKRDSSKHATHRLDREQVLQLSSECDAFLEAHPA